MGNVQPGTKLLLLCPDGTYKTYTVPSGVPMFSDLANDCQHSLIQVLP
jgi:hypothetical protein